MNRCTILTAGLVLCCCTVFCAMAQNTEQAEAPSPLEAVAAARAPLSEQDHLHSRRPKRTLFLKKKLLGAGLLGFGLGIAKGYKAGYYHGGAGPEVHHVYVAPPPPPPPPPVFKYVEYVEKPVYLERIVERPVFKSHPPLPEFEPSWSHPAEPSPVYGPSSW